MAKDAKKAKPPSNLAAVFKDKELTQKFEDLCKKEHTMENITFYQLKSWNAQNLFKIYFAKGAKNELNVSGDLLKKARDLGDKKAWDDRGWKEIYEDAQDQVFRLMEKDTFRRFLKTLKDEAP